MINIKRVFIVLGLIIFFLPTTFAQKVNQFDKNNKRTGVWKKYYNNKRLRYVGKFVNGKEVGVFKYYDITTTSHPTIIKKFSTTSDSASVKHYTLKGKLRSKGMMIGRNRVGKWIYYFSNGKLFSEENYVEGKLEGDVKNYFNNEKIAEHCEYKNGVKQGVSKKYSDQGILIEEMNYAEGKANGIAKYFNLKGDLKEEGSYKNGKRSGKWDFYIGGKKVSKKEAKKQAAFDKSKSGTPKN
ncbi:antitoxin component YwqK of YwqJK toxin-antitoxin module [Lutibacter sp. Hel_I_33_5]|uniref:toxin-antitoxin system YwqK family antitoxin n=1 Tax=Lutibacter sp. Hel_I_33_5 TaxID=1566289 RepID=UPI0011A6512F|nr:toxin-antitoxin system YwqK family antitoxin [Lutibacter sp. Hel_I_33_5]TVZ55131.1 antitoxin component YwqK of YwqJK toxin-antitoxin module [Lutibacter sp. Hel_I_33_5]